MSEQRGRNGTACRVDAQSEFQQQPGLRDALEVLDQGVHQLAGVGRICNDRIGHAVLLDRERILAGANVAGIDAAQAEGFKVPDQRPVAGTGLSKAADAAKVRDQRHHCCPWRRVEISLAALEVGSLAHLAQPLRSVTSNCGPATFPKGWGFRFHGWDRQVQLLVTHSEPMTILFTQCLPRQRKSITH